MHKLLWRTWTKTIKKRYKHVAIHHVRTLSINHTYNKLNYYDKIKYISMADNRRFHGNRNKQKTARDAHNFISYTEPIISEREVPETTATTDDIHYVHSHSKYLLWIRYVISICNWRPSLFSEPPRKQGTTCSESFVRSSTLRSSRFQCEIITSAYIL